MLTTSGFNSCGLYFSNAHGHYDVAVMILRAVAHGTHFTGAFLVLQLEGYLLLIGGAQEIEQILGIEADFHVRPTVLAGNAFLAFAGLDGGRKDLHLARGKLHADGPRALVGELRDALDRGAVLFAIQFCRCTLSLGRTLS